MVKEIGVPRDKFILSLFPFLLSQNFLDQGPTTNKFFPCIRKIFTCESRNLLTKLSKTNRSNKLKALRLHVKINFLSERNL